METESELSQIRVKIYAMVDPDTNEIRYVGKTAHSLEKRLRGHKSDAFSTHKTHSHRRHWIKSIYDRGSTPIMLELEEVLVSEWEEAERFWIAYFRFLGARLVNSAPGGIGCVGVDINGKGLPKSEDHRRKIGEANRGRIVPEEVRAKTRGSKNAAAKLTEFDVEVIMHALEHRLGTKKLLAKMYGISVASLRNIQKGLRWGHLGISNPELPKLYCTKLTLHQMRSVREDYRSGEYTVRDLGKKYACSYKTITNALTLQEVSELLHDFEEIKVLSRAESLALKQQRIREFKNENSRNAA